MNKHTTTKNLLVLLVALLFIFTYLLNYCYKIAACAAVFILLTFTVHTLYELFGKRYALISLFMSVIISYFGLRHYNYFIQGNNIQGLVIASLTSLLVSIYCSLKVRYHLNTTARSLSIKHLISLMVASGIDGFIMSIFSLRQLSWHRVTSIFIQEITYKGTYALGIYVLLFLYSYFIITKKIYKLPMYQLHEAKLIIVYPAALLKI